MPHVKGTLRLARAVTAHRRWSAERCMGVLRAYSGATKRAARHVAGHTGRGSEAGCTPSALPCLCGPAPSLG